MGSVYPGTAQGSFLWASTYTSDQTVIVIWSSNTSLDASPLLSVVMLAEQPPHGSLVHDEAHLRDAQDSDFLCLTVD